ncbi:MAG: glycosyltransferase [Xanthomonadaceae bacterium]|nr:glycosyltransferase [Xanthomonadaceae bacterium]
MSKRVLLISTVWPEPVSSAAGVRTLQILEFCQKAGYLVQVSSPSAFNAFQTALETRGIPTHAIPANDSRFDELVRTFNPDVVIYDRFLMEEQFGARVFECVPQALRIIDSQDLHFLRKSRAATPGQWLEDDVERELASIYRSDHTWLLSDFEHELLVGEFQVDPSYVSTMGFSYKEEYKPCQTGRDHFVWIGNFRHAPNLDSFEWLVRDLWPKIRSQLPHAELHIYGAYPPESVMKMNGAVPGLKVLGPARDVSETLIKYRALLSPLRFGAGIKGKIAESWRVGLPVVTTPIGAEGMRLNTGEFGGAVSERSSPGNEAEDFIRTAVSFYEDSDAQEKSVILGQQTLSTKFSFETNFLHFYQTIEGVSKIKRRLRNQRWTQKILWREQFRSAQYFSKWIELKNSR